MKPQSIRYTTLVSFLILAIAGALLLSACGPGNEIRLIRPTQPTVSVLPKPNAPRVAVVEFKDKRDDRKSIGQRRDYSSFQTEDAPSLWISHSLADALSRHGLMVSYAETFDQAKRATPDYIVSGKLERLWMKETSPTYLETTIAAQFTLANKEKILLQENNTAQSSRSWPTSRSQVEDMLRDTMVDLIEPIAKKFARTISKQKQ